MFKITYQPVNRISGVEPKTIEKPNAKSAWAFVNGLMHSDEKAEIIDPHGMPIPWTELKRLAEED